MTATIIWTIVILTFLGGMFAMALFLVAKKFNVEEDERIDLIEKALPGANCGGCGFAGCRAFAQACVREGKLDNLYCQAGGADAMKDIADILGCLAIKKDPLVAVVRCNGSCVNRPRTNDYDGSRSCRVKASLYSGDTDCRFGCVGCGDCVNACSYGALSMDSETGLPVVDESLCTGCGCCVKACPKGVIELRRKGPRGMRVFVSCVNKDKGGVARKACSVSCIGCGKCAKVCAHDAITIENNLAYIDFSKCKLCKKCVAECPTGAIHAVNFPLPRPKAEDNETK